MTIDDLDSNLDNLPQPASTAGGTAASIGGTLTSGTAGSVLFSGSAVFAQDNTNFFWDNATKQLELGIGLVTAPPYSFKADPNTGMYSTGADTLNWATGGVLGLSLDSTGLLTVRAGVVATAITDSGLTATRVPVAGTGGLLADFSTLTFTSGSGTLSATALQATGLTSTRIPFAGASGLLGDSSLLTVASGVITAAGLVASAATLPANLSITDSSAATQLEGLRVQHTTSISATAGAAVFQSFYVSNTTPASVEMARITAIETVVSAGSERSNLVFSTQNSGTLTPYMWLSQGALYAQSSLNLGSLTLASGAITQTVGISISSSMLNYNLNAATSGGHNFSGIANTSGARSFWIDTPPANTAITTATERITRAWGSAHTSGVPGLTSIVQTWANGTVALQRENVWNAPTYLQTSGTQVMTKAVHHDFGSIPQITGTTNSITGARIARFGGSVAQGVTAAAMDYVGIELVPHTITYTGTTQVTSTVGASMMRLDVLTLTDASAVTFDQCATLDIVGPVAAAGSVTITKPLSFLVRTGGTKIGGNIGFYNTDPVAKPTVTGSRATSAAIASLLTALASQGLITDSSSA